jgi:hypothetical protein
MKRVIIAHLVASMLCLLVFFAAVIYNVWPDWNRQGDDGVMFGFGVCTAPLSFVLAMYDSIAEFDEYPPAILCIPAYLISMYLLIRLTRKRLPRTGICEKCGYDLRATPDRCPECGTVPPTKEINSI